MDNKSIISSMLFFAGEPVGAFDIANFLQIPYEEVIECLENLNGTIPGIEIVKIFDKYQMVVDKEHFAKIAPFFDNTPSPKLSPAAMEVLSIIAYNDDVTKSTIESIRGVSCDFIISKLIDYGLIFQSGKLDVLGKPYGYRVTDKFFKTFGIESKKDLPTFEELLKYQSEDKQLQEFLDQSIEEKGFNEFGNKLDLEKMIDKKDVDQKED